MSPSRRSLRSSCESSKPSVVAATASSRRRLGGPGSRGGHEQAGSRQASAAHPAAELVELGNAETVRVEDHHERGVVHVHADLDDGGGETSSFVRLAVKAAMVSDFRTGSWRPCSGATGTPASAGSSRSELDELGDGGELPGAGLRQVGIGGLGLPGG